MSSAALAAASSLQRGDYITVALLALFAYDYVLTLPREIDYIWNKRWTMVSTLFLLVRYCGLYILLIFTLMWSSLLPGPEKVREILYLAAIWAFFVWIGAADLVMILRCWAMYSRSRVIIGILLTFWVLEMISSLIACIMYPDDFSVTVIQVFDLSYCEVTSSSVTWTKVSAIPEVINGAVMCILVLYQFVKRPVEIYKMTKRWHFNPYMNLLAIQSILYFLFIFFFNRTAILIASGNLELGGWATLILLPLQWVPAFALTPRFIMSIRTLHSHELQASWRGNGVGAGSSLSESRHRDGQPTSVLDHIRRPNSEETELDTEIPMEEWRITMEPSGNQVA